MKRPTRTGTNRRAGQTDDDGVTGAEYRAQNSASKPRRRKPSPPADHKSESKVWPVPPPEVRKAIMAGHERFLWGNFWPRDRAEPEGWQHMTPEERLRLRRLRYAAWLDLADVFWICELTWTNGGLLRR